MSKKIISSFLSIIILSFVTLMIVYGENTIVNYVISCSLVFIIPTIMYVRLPSKKYFEKAIIAIVISILIGILSLLINKDIYVTQLIYISLLIYVSQVLFEYKFK